MHKIVTINLMYENGAITATNINGIKFGKSFEKLLNAFEEAANTEGGIPDEKEGSITPNGEDVGE